MSLILAHQNRRCGASVPAWRSGRAWGVLAVVLIAGLCADLASKRWAFRSVAIQRDVVLANEHWMPPPHEPVAALPWELLDIHLVVNRGAVFGIGANQRFFFIAFTLAALATGVYVFGRLSRREHRLAHVAIGMILAGGIGNLYDRIVFGVVRDFLHMLPGRQLPFDWRWPGGSPEMFPWVFNIADMLLLFGMACLMWHMHQIERQRKIADSESSVEAMQPASSEAMT